MVFGWRRTVVQKLSVLLGCTFSDLWLEREQPFLGAFLSVIVGVSGLPTSVAPSL